MRASAVTAALVGLLVTTGAGAGREPARIVSVIDGDTVVAEVEGTATKVRLIGVDTPELHESPKLDRQRARGWDARIIVRLGRRAADYTRRRLDGRDVQLEFDAQSHDKYGRLLAYVWVDDRLFNADLLRHGYALRMTIPPNVRHADLFRRLEREARTSERGLWSEWPPRGTRTSPGDRGPRGRPAPSP